MKSIKIFVLLLVMSTTALAGLFSSYNRDPEKERRKRFEKSLDSLNHELGRLQDKIWKWEEAKKADRPTVVDEDSISKLSTYIPQRQQYLDSLGSWADILEANDNITGETLLDSLRTIAVTDTASIREYLRFVGLKKDLKSPGRPDTPQLEWLDSVQVLWQYCKEKRFDTRVNRRMDIRLEYVMRYGRPEITWENGGCTQIVKSNHSKYCIVYHWVWKDRMKSRDFEAVADGVEVSLRPTEDEKFGTKDDGEAIHQNLRDALDHMEANDTLIALNLAEQDTILGKGSITTATSVIPTDTSAASPLLVISAYGINCDSLAVDSTGKHQFHVERLIRDSDNNIVSSYISKSWRVASDSGATVPVACTMSIAPGTYTFTNTVRDDIGKRFGFLVNEVFVPSPYSSKGGGDIVRVFPSNHQIGGASAVAVGDTIIRVTASRLIKRGDFSTVFVRFPLKKGSANRLEYALYVNLFPSKKVDQTSVTVGKLTWMTDTLGHPVPKSRDSTGTIQYWPSQAKYQGSEWQIGEATLFNLVFSDIKGEELDSTFHSEFFDKVITFYVPKDKFDTGFYRLRVLAIINGKTHWVLLDVEVT